MRYGKRFFLFDWIFDWRKHESYLHMIFTIEKTGNNNNTDWDNDTVGIC